MIVPELEFTPLLNSAFRLPPSDGSSGSERRDYWANTTALPESPSQAKIHGGGGIIVQIELQRDHR